jgi:KDO2-lipid IV(A) lauroyltransferase
LVALSIQLPMKCAVRSQAPFFSVPAWTRTLVPRLIQRCDVEVLLASARRLPRGRGFRVELEPAPAGVYSPDSHHAAAAVNAGMERLIRRCPEQYLWKYKRYKHTRYPRLYDRSRPYRYSRRSD